MSKRKNTFRYNDSDNFDTEKFEFMDDKESGDMGDSGFYMDRNTMTSQFSSREARRERKKAKNNQRDRYLDEVYGY